MPFALRSNVVERPPKELREHLPIRWTVLCRDDISLDCRNLARKPRRRASADCFPYLTWVKTRAIIPTFNGNGNVNNYLNQAGAKVAHLEYDPFGNPTVDAESSVAALPCGFSTEPQEPVTRLRYYGYRYYDPLTGRWPSRDPIEEGGGKNLYGFVFNNAFAWYDYLGREPRWINFVPRQDTSIPRGKDATQKNLESKATQLINVLNENLECCCKLYKIGCDGQGKPNVRARLVDGPANDTPQAPQDGKYLTTGQVAINALGKRTGNSIPLTFTDSSIASGEGEGLATKDSGVLVDRQGEAPAVNGGVLSHELGHVAGFVGNNPRDRRHDVNTDPDAPDQSRQSLMAQPPGTNPTTLWCEKVVELAK